MPDDNVIDFFTRQPVRPPMEGGDDPDEETAVNEWMEENLHPLMQPFRTALDTFNPDEFRDAIEEIRTMVSEWPDIP